jgi:serine/threonine protein kinase
MNFEEAPDGTNYPELSLLPPELILQERYRVLHPLGSGGFGQVFEIIDGSTPKVLKVLAPQAFKYVQAQQQAIAFLQREADFLSRARHPGIPSVEADGYFVWQDKTNAPFHCLVMEKVTGMNLQTWMQQTPAKVLSQPLAIAWLQQLIEILSYLHERQFLHRDIKPSNIMLKPDGQLVLIDFGGVREITETYLRKQHLQATGTALISAGYTPPEQIEGHAIPQSDFFALGRTFVALFTGSDPLLLPKDPQTGQVIWRDRATHISTPFADLIDYLMAPLPGQRPQNCALLAQVCSQVQRQLTIQQYLPWLKRLPQWNGLMLRHRLRSPQFRSILLKSGLAGVLVAGGFSIWMNRVDISLYFNEQGAILYEEQNNDQLAEWFYQVALLLNPDNSAANYNLGTLYESRQQFDQARAAYQKAADQKLIRAYNNLARLYILSQQYRQAVSLLQLGLEQPDSPEQPKSETIYPLRKNLGWAYFGLKQYERAETELQQAIDLNPQAVAAHCLMGQVLQAQMKRSIARPYWQRCLTGESQGLEEEQAWQEQARKELQSEQNHP